MPLPLLPGVARQRSDSCDSSDSSLPSLSGTSFSGASLTGTVSSSLYIEDCGTSFSGASLTGTVSSSLYSQMAPPDSLGSYGGGSGRVSFGGTLPAASPRTSLAARDSTRAWWEVFGNEYEASWRASNATLSDQPIDAQPARTEVEMEAEDDSSGDRNPAPPVEVRERRRTLVEAFLDLFSKREDEPCDGGGTAATCSKRASGCDVQGRIVRVPAEALLDSDGRK